MLPHIKEIKSVWRAQRERERERESLALSDLFLVFDYRKIVMSVANIHRQYSQSWDTSSKIVNTCYQTSRLVRYNLRPNATVLSGTVLKKINKYHLNIFYLIFYNILKFLIHSYCFFIRKITNSFFF